MKSFLDEQKFGPWNPVSCNIAKVSIGPITVVSDDGTGGVSAVTPPPGVGGEIEGPDKRSPEEKIFDENQLRKEFLLDDIEVNKGPCNVNESFKAHIGGCTDVSGLTQTTQSAIYATKQDCRCEITITGGSELGHSGGSASGHSAGYKFDLRPNTELNKFVTENSDRFDITTRSGRPGWVDTSTGNFWVREFEGGIGDHWDVLVEQAGDVPEVVM